MKFVIDASVAIKPLTGEIYYDIAKHILSGDHELHGPELLLAEMGNIVWKKRRRQELTEQEAILAIKLILKRGVLLHSHADLIEIAYQGAQNTGQTVYDWLYLACAVKLSCQMVTADRKFYEAVHKTQFENYALWIEDAI